MTPDSHEFIAKNGRIIMIRSARVEDARAMVDYLKTTAGESDNLTKSPEEVVITVSEEEAFLKGLIKDERRFMLNAFDGDKLVGNIYLAEIGSRKRIRHRASMGIAVIQDYWGLGISRALMMAALHTAEKLGFEQVELGVYANNENALKLYQSLGFEIYGRLPRACKLGKDKYQDDLLMVKTLPQGGTSNE